MKKWLLPLSIATGVFALSGCNGAEDKAVANSKAGDVTTSELYAEMKTKYEAQMEQTLQELMQKKVLAEKYEVTDEEVEAKIKDLKKELGDQYETALSQSGMDEEGLKEYLKLEILREKAAFADVKVTDKELKEFYNTWQPEINVSHILVADEKKAAEVKQKLAKGSKFEDLAKEYSSDTASAEKGGSLGWIDNSARGQFVPEFTAALSKLKVNQVSAPVKTQFGYHIIKITEQKEKESFGKMKDQLSEELKKSKLDDIAIQKKIDEEMKSAEVKVVGEDFKDAFKTEETSSEDEKATDSGAITEESAK
ncbi:peptidylprolyl isomerase [Domibacillus robiginosus]|uniref:peptidylprolyl isomerase n=1 Tax=Domibacillus robiginosus TaxID=1071054 RepID=UPI00067D98B5|nr:peptidylprolyl isomerase [Domibacillus robiginosus]